MKARHYLAAVLIACSTAVAAQTQDFNSWSTFSLNKKLNDKFKAGTDLEFRMRDNLTNYNLFYVNLGVTYKPLDWLSVSGVYRFIHKHKDDGTYGLRNRYYLDAAAKFKTGQFSFGYRARYQVEFRGAGYSDKYAGLPEIYLRHKFDIKYKINDRFTPYVGTEVREQITNPRVPYLDAFSFDRDRLYAGVDFSINDNNTLGFYFLRQFEFNVEEPETLNVLGIEYSLNLD